jgi:hypothetical protein
MKRLVFLYILGLVIMAVPAVQASVATYEDLTLGPESYWNGSDGSGGFISGGHFHNNTFTDWGGGYTSWDGFAYSNKTDINTTGTNGQYTAYSIPDGGGVDGSSNYAIGYVGWSIPPTVTLPGANTPSEAYFTNNAYAYWSMVYGDTFAKKFGGETGNDPDWFLLTITGKDAVGVTGTVDFYLADYRFEDDALDYIVDDWTSVDLSPLGTASSVEFALSSSDTGPYGMNTPAYFAMDNLSPVPEPATILLLISGLLGIAGFRKASKSRTS